MSTISTKTLILYLPLLAFLAFINIGNVQAFGVVPPASTSIVVPKASSSTGRRLFVSTTTTTNMMEDLDTVSITNVSPSTSSSSSPSYEECMASFVQRHVTIGVASLMVTAAVVTMMMHS